MSCAVCEKPIPFGHNTCGPECTDALVRNPKKVEKADDTPPAEVAPFLIGTQKAADQISVSYPTIYGRIQTGKLQAWRVGGRVMVDSREVEKMRKLPVGSRDEEPLVSELPPPPVRAKAISEDEAPRVQKWIGTSLQLESIRARGLKAAKEAFREVILEASDEAKGRGDFQLQARLLEDYVYFEEGLKLVYSGRPDA